MYFYPVQNQPKLRKFITILLLLLATGVHAQKEVYIYTRLHKNDGLASNHVYAVLQDSHGFMWFGTSNGLQRYDGQQFQTFRHIPGRSNQLPDNKILRLMEDDSSRIWAASSSGVTLFHIAGRYLKQVPVMRGNLSHTMEILDIFRDREGNIWLTTRKQGAFIYNPKTGHFDPALTCLPQLAHTRIMDVVQDPLLPYLWLATDDGIRLYDQEKNKCLTRENTVALFPFLSAPEFRKPILNLMIDRQHRVWIMTWDAATVSMPTFVSDDRQHQRFHKAAAAGEQAMLFEDSRKRVWSVGEFFTSYQQGSGTFETIHTDERYQYGIDFDRIYHISEDKQHNLWLGTSNGIFLFNPDPKKAGTVLLRAGMDKKTSALNITGFCEIPGGDVIVSTWGSGLYYFDPQFRLKKEFSTGDVNGDLCWSLAYDSAQNIWVGCQLGYLMRFDKNGTLVEKGQHPVFDNRTIRCITVARNGEVWLGTQHGLIVKYDPATNSYTRFTDQRYPSGEQFGNINKLVEDPRGRIWATTSTYGIIEIDRQTGAVKQRFSQENKTNKTLSYGYGDLLWLSDTLFAAASDYGIELINPDNGRMKQFTLANGLPDNMIVNILKENEAYLCFSTNHEVGRLHIPSGKTVVYGARDGILDDNYESIANIRLRSGKLLIGGNRTIAFIQPDKKVEVAPLPNVTITGFKLFSIQQPLDSILSNTPIRLSHRENYFTVEFASLSYADKDKIVYYYQLEGVDKDWVRAGNIRFATYTNLDGGNYTFRVKAEKADGSAVTPETTLKIHISSPYWRSWWFYLLAAVLLAGIVYLVQRIRIQRLLDMESVRKRIARDLHDDMGSTLSTINILSEMARMKIHTDQERALEFIHSISDNSSRMMESMDDIVWSINPVNDSMQNILARMREFATTVLEPKDILCEFIIDDQVQHIKLDLESRHDFFMIFKESVNNIAKYAGATQVRTEVTLKRSILYLRIEDNGRGFDTMRAEYGNGIANMHKRAQELKGKLRLDSVPGKGTAITLEFNIS